MARIVDGKPEPLGGLLAFIALGRPLFLAGGAVFYGLGLAAAAHERLALDWGAAAWGYLAVAAAQLMNHYSNDYYDLDADMANRTATPWSGGSRVLAERRLHPRVAFWAAVGFGGLALLLALAAGRASGSAAGLGALLVGAGLAWVYSGPPLFLHRRGLGEVVGAAVIPGLTVVAAYALQTGRLAGAALLCVLPLCLLQFAMLVAVSVPDAAGDRAVGKRTLVVLLGARTAAWLYAGAVVLAYLALPLLWGAGLPAPVALAPLGLAPVAAWNAWRALGGRWSDPAGWASLGFWSIGQLVGGGALMLAAFVLWG